MAYPVPIQRPPAWQPSRQKPGSGGGYWYPGDPLPPGFFPVPPRHTPEDPYAGQYPWSLQPSAPPRQGFAGFGNNMVAGAPWGSYSGNAMAIGPGSGWDVAAYAQAIAAARARAAAAGPSIPSGKSEAQGMMSNAHLEAIRRHLAEQAAMHSYDYTPGSEPATVAGINQAAARFSAPSYFRADQSTMRPVSPNAAGTNPFRYRGGALYGYFDR